MGWSDESAGVAARPKGVSQRRTAPRADGERAKRRAVSKSKERQDIDKETFELAKAGDRRAWRLIFDAYQPALMSYCLLSARRDRDRATDLVQEILLRAFKGIGKLREHTRLRAWLWTIAANVCRTQGAGENRYRQILAAYALHQGASAPSEDKAHREARIEVVGQLLEGVSDPQLRQIVLLKYTEPEHTTRQIAQKLDLPHGTVTVKLMRFRARFKRLLASALVEFEGVTP